MALLPWSRHCARKGVAGAPLGVAAGVAWGWAAAAARRSPLRLGPPTAGSASRCCSSPLTAHCGPSAPWCPLVSFWSSRRKKQRRGDGTPARVQRSPPGLGPQAAHGVSDCCCPPPSLPAAGCRFPAAAVDGLREEAASGGAAAGPNAEAWLQRAFGELAVPQDHGFTNGACRVLALVCIAAFRESLPPPARHGRRRQPRKVQLRPPPFTQPVWAARSREALSLTAGMMQSVPSALDEHVPALAGPLAVATAAGELDGGDGGASGPLMRLAGGGDVAVSLQLSRWAAGPHLPCQRQSLPACPARCAARRKQGHRPEFGTQGERLCLRAAYPSPSPSSQSPASLQPATGAPGAAPCAFSTRAPQAHPPLCCCRFSEGCTAAAVATARGWVGLHLLTGGGPAWCESAPQCVAQGVELLAVRSQVRCRRGSPALC